VVIEVWCILDIVLQAGNISRNKTRVPVLCCLSMCMSECVCVTLCVCVCVYVCVLCCLSMCMSGYGCVILCVCVCLCVFIFSVYLFLSLFFINPDPVSICSKELKQNKKQPTTKPQKQGPLFCFCLYSLLEEQCLEYSILQ